MYTLSLELRVIMTHEGCDEQTVLGALVDEARCVCGHTARFDLARWSRALDEPIGDTIDDADEDWYWTSEDKAPDATLGFAYRRRAPWCAGCRAALRLDDVARGPITCSCGTVAHVRELPAAIEALGLPRPAWVVGEAPGRDELWIVCRLDGAVGFAGKQVWRELGGVVADRTGALIVIWSEKDQGRVAKLGPRGEIVWQVDSIGFDDHAYLVGSPAADEVAIVDPRTNNLQFVDTRDGALVRTLQGPAPEHEKRDEDGFRRREPQTIDVYYHGLLGVGIGPDGTIAIVRDWYDGLSRSLRRFDRDGNPLKAWRRRPGFLSILFSNAEDDRPSWQLMKDRPLEVSGWGDAFGVARDGSLLLAGRESEVPWLARWHADGRLDGTWPLPAWCRSVRAIAGDARGTPVLLCDRDEQRVVARLEGGDLRVLGGPWSNGEEHLHVCDDGAIVIARRGDSLRVLEPDGRTRWRSRACVREDRKRATSSC